MPKSKRIIKSFEAINEALVMCMKRNKNVILIGLGVDDPKGIFGTTKNQAVLSSAWICATNTLSQETQSAV
mgnify:CR=1 FL=1